jgi:hypothetical protein
MIVSIDDINILIIRKSIKHVYVRINSHTGDVKVSAPHALPVETIKKHLATKINWIHQTRERAVQVLPQTSPTHSVHHFLGQPYNEILHINATKNEVRLDGEHIHLHCKSTINDPLIHLHHWYKQQMHALLPELIQKWEVIIGVSIHAYGIKAMKTRWGSCNVRTKRIWLNMHLIKKPLICIEYVLVHEMVHLLEASHNKRFYALMTQFMPEWKNHHNMLENKKY